MNPRRLILAAIMAAVVLTGSDSLAGERLSVFVTIAPQKFFVEKVGGNFVDIEVLVAPGANPHNYEPRPKQMVALSKADLYFTVGILFEQVWLPKITDMNPSMRVIHTEKGIVKRKMESHEGHGENKTEADAGGGKDPHIWLSPELVEIQVGHIKDALVLADPSHRDVYESNSRDFLAEIERLNKEIRRLFEGEKGSAFMVYHPTWGYFADAYGLEQIPVEIEGKSPTPRRIQLLVTKARQRGIRVIFAQPQVSRQNATVLAKEIGGRVVLADPLAYDWIENLRGIARKFKEAVK